MGEQSHRIELSAGELLREIGTFSREYEHQAREFVARWGKCWNTSSVFSDAVLEFRENTWMIKSPEMEWVSLGFGDGAGHLKNGWARVAIYSAGQKIDQIAEELSQTVPRNYIHSYLLDSLGLKLLEKTLDILVSDLEAEARERGWGVGPVLCPGGVEGWEIGELVKLYRLVSAERIGVELSSSGMLRPARSVGVLIGFGPDYRDHRAGSSCRVCSLRSHCSVRQRRQQEKSDEHALS